MQEQIKLVRKRSTELRVGPGLDMERRANILVTEVGHLKKQLFLQCILKLFVSFSKVRKGPFSSNTVGTGTAVEAFVLVLRIRVDDGQSRFGCRSWLK